MQKRALIRMASIARVLFIVAAMLTSSASAFAQSQNREIVVDRIVARVNDDIVTQSEVARFLPIYIQVMGPSNPEQLRTRAGQQALMEELIQFLIDAHLLQEKARELGMELTADDVEASLENYRRQLEVNEDEFRAALEAEGISFEDYRLFMRKYLTRVQLMQAEGLRDVTVSDEEVRARFEEEYPEGLEETYVETSHIFIDIDMNAPDEEFAAAEELLLELRAQILAGERTFGEVASEVNEDSTAGREGRLAAFAVADLDPSFSRTALALEEGGISEPVVTPRGMHLIRLEGVEHRSTGDADRIRRRIRFQLQQQRVQQRQSTYLERLRRNAFVEILVDDFSL